MKAINTFRRVIKSMGLKRCSLTLWCIWMCAGTQAQNLALQWAINTSSPELKGLSALAVDSEGNTLIAIDSDAAFTIAGSLIPYLALVSETFGSTLVKLDPAGNVLWHRSLKGPWQNTASCGGIDTDEDNNIYVSYSANSYVENATPIGGLYALTSRNYDYFLVKISPEGTGLWYKVANYAPGTISTPPLVKVSPDGSVYTSGPLGSSVNFDGTVLVNQNILSIYVAKHDLNGHLLWAKSITSQNGEVRSLSRLDVGSDGSLYMAGEWKGDSLHIDHLSIGNNLAFTGNGDRWICKLAPNGTAEWLAREHSDGVNGNTSIAVTHEDGLMVLSYKGEEDLYIGDITVSNPGVVLSHYSASGEVISGALIGGEIFPSVWSRSLAIARNGEGSYYVGGSFNTPTYTIGGIELSNMGGTTGTADTYLAKMNEAGAADWIYTIASPESEFIRYIGAPDGINFVAAGILLGTELTIESTTLVPHTEFNQEVFIASFSTTLNTRTAEALQQLIAYPNPFTENVQFDAEALQAFGNATLVVFNTSGAEVYRKQLQGNDLGQLNLAHLPKGTYIARLSDGKRSLHTKIIKH